MGKPVLAMRYERARFQRGAAAYLRDLPAFAIRPAAAMMAGEVVDLVITSVNTSPRRVDTGRYASSWAQAARKLKTKHSRLQIKAFKGTVVKSSRSRDAKVKRKGRGLKHVLTVGSSIPYAQLVEFGNNETPPGNHLSKALATVGNTLQPPGLLDEMVRLWYT